MVALLMVALMVAQKDVQTVNLISLHMDLNAAIQLQMSLVLAVLILKLIIAGIAPVVIAHLMVIQFVVMVHVMVMKPMKHAQMIVMHLVNVMLVI